MVRRRLAGEHAAHLLCHRFREAARGLSRIRHAGQPVESLRGHAHRHDRRPPARGPVRLEDRRQGADRLEHLPAAGRQQGLDLRPRRHLRRQGRGVATQHQRRLDQLRLFRRGKPVRQGTRRHVYDQADGSGPRSRGRLHDRPHVRELLRRDQDPDREGLQHRVLQADRRHRPDRPLDPVRRVLHAAARRRQHDCPERA